MRRYLVYLEGCACGVTREFDDYDDAIAFLYELMQTREAVEGNPVCIKIFED